MGAYARWQRGWSAERTALVADGEALTFETLHERVRRANGWLRDRGVQPGEVIALSMPKGIDWLALALAALRLGAPLLPLNDRYTPRELRLPLEDAPARVAVLPDALAAELGAQRAPEIVSASALREALAASAPHDPPDPGDEARALLLYTSGTTGRPKGVPLRARQVEATVEALHVDWRWSPEDVLLHALPPYHVHGLVVAAFGALRAGAAQIWLPQFDAADVLDRLAAGPATVFMGVPTFWSRMLDVPGRFDLRRVRLATSGSAGLPAAVHRAVRERFGLAVVERYGMTEIGIVIGNPLDDPRPGSIGRPFPGVELRIVDVSGEDGGREGRPVAPGGVGELWIRAPSAFDGYHDLPGATAEAVRDGFVRTGDLGSADGEGRITLVGRRSELILVGGFNVYPAEIEAALLALPGVREAAVYGVEHPDLGEVPRAAVVGEVDPEGLRAALREVLAPYKIPRRILRIEALPRNAMGKVVKAGLPRD